MNLVKFLLVGAIKMQLSNNHVLKKNSIRNKENSRKIVTTVEEKIAEQQTHSYDEVSRLAHITQTLIQRAEKEREEILKLALQEAESIKQKAREKGYVDGQEQGKKSGFKIGMQQAQEQAQIMKTKIMEEQQAAQLEIEEWEQDARRQMIGFGIQFTENLIHQQIHQDESILAKMVSESIEDLDFVSDKITVKVHPTNVEIIQTYFTTNPLFYNQKIQVLSDEEFDRFDYHIETENQKIIFDLKHVLEKLKISLLQAERASA